MFSETTVTTAEKEIIVSRLLNAPRSLVFLAFTDPRLLQKWWGPKEFTNTFHSFELKPGGKWLFDMVGPDGKVWPNLIEYTEIINPEKIVYHHSDGTGNDPNAFNAEITFQDMQGKTQITLKLITESEEVLKRHLEFGAVEGGKSTMESLDEFLSGLNEGEIFKLERRIKAPRSLVFEAFTRIEHLLKWWGPKGFKMESATFDLRPNGIFHYYMTSPEGFKMYGKFVYHEINSPTRLVFTTSFSDENAGTQRHPLSDSWPLETLSIIDFEELDGETVLKMQGLAKNASEAENKMFTENFKNMEAGFGGTMQQLDAYLAELQASV